MYGPRLMCFFSIKVCLKVPMKHKCLKGAISVYNVENGALY